MFFRKSFLTVTQTFKLMPDPSSKNRRATLIHWIYWMACNNVSQNVISPRIIGLQNLVTPVSHILPMLHSTYIWIILPLTQCPLTIMYSESQWQTHIPRQIMHLEVLFLHPSPLLIENFSIIKISYVIYDEFKTKVCLKLPFVNSTYLYSTSDNLWLKKFWSHIQNRLFDYSNCC